MAKVSVSLPISKNRSTVELAWLAGLLEGEGWFGLARKRCPTISVQMTDKDVVEKAARVMNGKLYRPYEKGTHRPVYRVQVAGASAIGWMLTLFTFLGERRRQRIKDVVTTWKEIG